MVDISFLILFEDEKIYFEIIKEWEKNKIVYEFFKCYFESNRQEDIPKLVSDVIIKIMKNYKNLKDSELMAKIMNLACTYLDRCPLNKY